MAAAVERISRILILLSLLLLYLYIAGNFQQFLDSSQSLLLTGLEYTTLIGGLFTLYSLIYRIVAAFWQKRIYTGKLILNTVILAVNIALLLLIKLARPWFQV
jgi:hypothetical protein